MESYRSQSPKELPAEARRPITVESVIQLAACQAGCAYPDSALRRASDYSPNFWGMAGDVAHVCEEYRYAQERRRSR